MYVLGGLFMDYPVGLVIAVMFLMNQENIHGADSPEYVAAMKSLVTTTERLGCSDEMVEDCVFECYAGSFH